LVIVGRLDIGALVAVIAAYKDLPAPVKELIDWDQQRMDVEIKYGQVVEQFTAEEVAPAELQAPLDAPELPREGRLKAAGVSLPGDGARQPALWPQAPPGARARLRRGRQARARGATQGGGAHRQQHARHPGRLDRLRRRRRRRSGGDGRSDRRAAFGGRL